MNIEKKRKREIRVVEEMIKLYCRRHDDYCYGVMSEEYRLLFEQAKERIEHCPFMETKTFCHNCKTPCYSKNMMEKITHIMKSEGKKMLLKHPLTAVEQAYYVMRSKRNGNVV